METENRPKMGRVRKIALGSAAGGALFAAALLGVDAATAGAEQTTTTMPTEAQFNTKETNPGPALDKKYLIALGAASVVAGGLVGDVIGRHGLDKYGAYMELAGAACAAYIGITEFYTASNINSGHHAYAIILPAAISGMLGAKGDKPISRNH